MVVNQFFKNADGQLVKGYGFGLSGLKWYDADGNYDDTPMEIVKAEWTPQPELKWFPSTPVGDRCSLPYDFDLHWDVKKIYRDHESFLRNTQNC